MRIIVTGCKGLIGTELARHFKKGGHTVIGCDVWDGCDLTKEPFVKTYFKQNKADALVNCFALDDKVTKKHEKTTLFTVPLESFDQYMKVNLTALFSVCREYARNSKNGSIVNFASTYGINSPFPDMYGGSHKHAGYAASKAGVIGLTKYLAVHLAPKIRVNCVAPGGVRHVQSKDFIERYSGKTPMGRMMDVHELNGIVEYLCSEVSSYVTGTVFSIDGGWTAW